jgi:hypothetical protein
VALTGRISIYYKVFSSVGKHQSRIFKEDTALSIANQLSIYRSLPMQEFNDIVEHSKKLISVAQGEKCRIGAEVPPPPVRHLLGTCSLEQYPSVLNAHPLEVHINPQGLSYRIPIGSLCVSSRGSNKFSRPIL